MTAVDTAPMLAGLIAQAEQEGAELLTLRALVEEASERGAACALRRLGLHDSGAVADIGELRRFVQNWREARRTVRNACLAWAVRGALAALAMALALKFGLPTMFGA